MAGKEGKMTRWHNYFHLLVGLSTVAFAATVWAAYWRLAALVALIAIPAWFVHRKFKSRQ